MSKSRGIVSSSGYSQIVQLMRQIGHNNDVDVVRATIAEDRKINLDGGLTIDFDDCWRISNVKPEYEEPLKVGDRVCLLVDQRNAAQFQAYYIGKIYSMT
ncbi:hypothetical protein [Priestia koreensis]|uniref:hypothetical protein n=1 Tax=Priestia koreensis TaxID=284581 RepID=UPI00301A0770